MRYANSISLSQKKKKKNHKCLKLKESAKIF